MLVDKQNELMSNLLFTVYQHGGDDVTWKPPICKEIAWPPGLLEKKQQQSRVLFDVIFHVYTHVDNRERASSES